MKFHQKSQFQKTENKKSPPVSKRAFKTLAFRVKTEINSLG